MVNNIFPDTKFFPKLSYKPEDTFGFQTIKKLFHICNRFSVVKYIAIAKRILDDNVISEQYDILHSVTNYTVLKECC